MGVRKAGGLLGTKLGPKEIIQHRLYSGTPFQKKTANYSSVYKLSRGGGLSSYTKKRNSLEPQKQYGGGGANSIVDGVMNLTSDTAMDTNAKKLTGQEPPPPQIISQANHTNNEVHLNQLAHHSPETEYELIRPVTNLQ